MMRSAITAVLGPTNTGKTHLAVERLCAHSSGMIGLPLRLLAREVYDRVVAIKGPREVALITGEERIAPEGARWLICTAESMPLDRDVSFLAIDEAQLGADRERGHVFTDRLLHARGREETMILGSDTLRPLVRKLVPEAEIVARPRFSKLSYAGAKKLSRLPPRSAIVAFSAEEVYAIAELIRRTRGGAAVVMGALSPRTRNAQVAMFQSGEVDFLVATDAIGMGLNMDVGHVAFASLSKFDGQRQRRLTVAEMAQIAGRAGRHQRDGTFGTIAGDQGLTDIEIDRIENHSFPALDHLYWRNGDPDCTSIETLVETLEIPPDRIELRSAPEATDLAVLKRLALDPEVNALAASQAAVARLWEVCGLPDFRKTGPEFHAALVGRLYRWLHRDVIPVKIIADELARLDSVQGDISTIAARIASARTWAYAAQRKDWVKDPLHWAERTWTLEEKLSDALHAKLTQRFVDKRTRSIARSLGGSTEAVGVAFAPDGAVSVDGDVIGSLHGFQFRVDPAARHGERKKLIVAAEHMLAKELGARADALAAAPDVDLTLTTNPGFAWRGAPVAKLQRGDTLLTPRLTLTPEIQRLPGRLRNAIEIRVAKRLNDLIATRLPALRKLEAQATDPRLSGTMRALLANLVAQGGTVSRSDLAAELALLTPDEKRRIRQMGVTIGALDIFHPGLLKPGAVTLLATLRAASNGTPVPPLPMPGLGILHHPSPQLAASAPIAGYREFGDQMVRIDLVERIGRALHDQRRGAEQFAPDVALATSMGIGDATFTKIIRALGFRPAGENEGLWKWRGLNRPARRAAKPLNPSFAALGAWGKGARH